MRFNVVAWLSILGAVSAARLRNREPELTTFDSGAAACSSCLKGNHKEHFEWCSCFARETDGGAWTSQCQRPKIVASFYTHICRAGAPNLETGMPGGVQATPVNPMALEQAA